MFLLDFVVALIDLARLLIRAKAIGRRGRQLTLVGEWKKTVLASGRATFVVAADEKQRSVSYATADALSDEVARWLGEEAGVKAGDTVGMMMGSSIEFCIVFIGIAKARCKAALVNVALRGDTLAHALNEALGDRRPSLVIADSEFVEFLGTVRRVAYPNGPGGPELHWPPSVSTAKLGAYGRVVNPEVDDDDKKKRRRRWWWWWWHRGSMSIRAPTREEDEDDAVAFVYTSGTTGFPKAAKVSHSRAWAAGTCFATLSRLRSSDRVYCALPLYHATAGLLGLWGVIRAGSTIVVRKKFSASKFARDLSECRATGCLYVGEMARYLVDSPGTNGHSIALRFAFGNGMPPDAWVAFQNKYRIGRMIELYGSTEGNVNLFNNTGVVGACGIVPLGFRWLYPVLVAKLAPPREDDEFGDVEQVDGLARDHRGLCIPCDPNEPGELLGKIRSDDPSRRFDGYLGDHEQTRRKIVRNVKRLGDAYFRSGDLVRMDRVGFLYFIDRLGDTFRWKGENVSTCQVQHAAMQAAPDILLEAVAFGVTPPPILSNRPPGKCGMLALVLRTPVADEDWPRLLFRRLETATSGLPDFAIPRFLRVVPFLPKTSTHKYLKKTLAEDQVDPARCWPDPLFIRDPQSRTYLPFDDDARSRLVKGDIRL